MPKRKKSYSKGYISKGERPNVNGKILKAIENDRKKTPAIEDMLKSYFHRKRVILKPQNKKEKELADRYQKEDYVISRSFDLLDRYSKAGLTKAEAVMAIKTDKIPSLTNKWKPRLSAWIKEQKEKQKKVDILKFSGTVRIG